MLSQINVGCGEDISIREVAEAIAKAIAKTVGYSGEIKTDPAKPDGAPRKLMDSSRLNKLGWAAQVGLKNGLVQAYKDFLANHEQEQGLMFLVQRL